MQTRGPLFSGILRFLQRELMRLHHGGQLHEIVRLNCTHSLSQKVKGQSHRQTPRPRQLQKGTLLHKIVALNSVSQNAIIQLQREVKDRHK